MADSGGRQGFAGRQNLECGLQTRLVFPYIYNNTKKKSS